MTLSGHKATHKCALRTLDQCVGIYMSLMRHFCLLARAKSAPLVHFFCSTVSWHVTSFHLKSCINLTFMSVHKINKSRRRRKNVMGNCYDSILFPFCLPLNIYTPRESHRHFSRWIYDFQINRFIHSSLKSISSLLAAVLFQIESEFEYITWRLLQNGIFFPIWWTYVKTNGIQCCFPSWWSSKMNLRESHLKSLEYALCRRWKWKWFLPK